MKRFKALSLLLAVVLILSVSACTLKGPDKKLVVATNAQFPPFEYVTEAGQGVIDKYDGIDILIVQEIAKDHGFKIEIADMEFNSIIASVTTGKADIGVAGMTDTADRRENVDFSIPYWVAVQTIIVPETNTDITSAESLKGKKVGVVTGYTGDSALSDMGDINLLRFNKGIDAVMELTNGKLDAVVIDSPTANRFIEKFDGLKAVYDDTVFETEQYAIAVQKGNQELLDKINSTIERLIANKDIERFAEEIDARFQS
ncbi:MAG: transporter substrate-binding domain-containing protein [Clostridiales bacterium]|nr:transporter substrate-binding domain-containing protein [Clostridiales bacterium]